MAAELTVLENMRAFAPELPGEIQAVVDKLLLGESSAEEARLALLDLAAANPDFSLVIGQLAGVAAEIRTVTAAADEMHAALNAAGGPTGDEAGRGGAGASRRARIEAQEAAAAYISEQDRILGLSREQLSLEQAITAEKERATAAGITLGDAEAKRLAQLRITQSARSSGGGGTGGVEKLDADMARYRERVALLEMETELQRSLNPLVNDYGFALEKARAQHELELAAAKAGLELTPQRREEIEKLAESYGTATANAARLAEEQGLLRQSMDDLGNAARSALDSIIDGFMEGKNAGEILNSVLRDLARNMLSIGMNLISGGIKAAGIIPFAEGGIAAHGMPQPIKKFARGGVSRTAAIFGEAGPEAAVPLPDGRRIPVELRMPPMPQVQVAAAPSKLTVHVSLDDDLLRAVVKDEAGRTVATAAPTIVGAAVGQANKSAPAAVASYQRQRGGADWRNM